MSTMDLMPSAEELREHLVNHDFAVRQIILLDGYIERLSEQTFVSAIGNRLAVAFQKMIRITVAEGLKRMYKEYRLKQWMTLLDKAATLRRLLEQQERELDSNNSRQFENRLENPAHPTDRHVMHQPELPASSNDFRTHETQHDWERAAPEAYDWHPVTDYRARTESTGARNQLISPRYRNPAATAISNPASDFNSIPNTVSENIRPTADNSLMDFETTETQDNAVQQNVLQAQQPQVVSNNNPLINQVIADMNDIVEAMEEIFHDSEDELSTENSPEPQQLPNHDVFVADNDLPELIQQSFRTPLQSGQAYGQQNLTSPILRQQMNMTSSPVTAVRMNMSSTPADTPVMMTSSPAPEARVLEDMNQASILGESMSAHSPARRSLLWRDDPPNPADHPPRLLRVVAPPSENIPTNPATSVTESNEETPVVNTAAETVQASNQERPVEMEPPQAELESSFQSFVSWDSSVDSNDIDSLGGILYAAERLGPMDQTMHMDVEMGDMGLGHLLFDRAAGTWATSHCEFHRTD